MTQMSRPKQRLCFLVTLLGILCVLYMNFFSNKSSQKKIWRSRTRPNFNRQGDEKSYFLPGSLESASDADLEEHKVPFEIPNDGEPDFYGVMFDAGSTGSRVHVFHFVATEGKPPMLVEELYNYTKVGLSTFAKKPEEGAASLKPLLDAALDFIPAEKWSSSPVALKATAGLRLLPEEEADALLEAVIVF